MIAKRIDKAPDIHDSYAFLARYVAAARESGEKLDRLWIANCDAGDGLADLELAIAEIEATRAFNTRAANRTYHLLISFRPGELERLSTDDLKAIERTFAEALGFGAHQRIAATHINTDNPHIHVAISTIHPQTMRAHTPRRDFVTLARVKREMEAKYGLAVDRGMTDDDGRNPASVAARDFEARTWQQSFQSYVLEHQADILAGLSAATTWPEVHQGLDGFGIEIRRRGAGLVLVEQDGQQAMKASALDRACALKALEDRLGPFQPRPPALPPRPTAARRRRYQARPLTTHPATAQLWRRYLGLRRGGLRPVGPPGPLAQAMSRGLIQSWRDFLLEDARRDGMAMAVVLAYRQMLHAGPHRPREVPKVLKPSLRAQFAAAQWAEPRHLPWAWAPRAAGGLKVDDHGRLLIPFRDALGSIQGLRAIEADGRTADLPGFGRVRGLTHVLDPERKLSGEPPYVGPLLLATDHAEAAQLQAATGLPVVLAARPRDVAPAAAALRARHPEARLVFACDPEAAALAGVEAPPLNRVFAASAAAALEALRHGVPAAAQAWEASPDAPPAAAVPTITLVDPGQALGWAPVVLIADPDAAQTVQAALGQPVAAAPPDGLAAVAAYLGTTYPGQPVQVISQAGLDRLMRAARQAAEESLRTALAARVGDRAWPLWASATPADPAAPWLHKVGIRGYGLRQSEDGGLLVPLTDRAGRLRDVLVIDPQGTARPVAPDPEGPPLWHRLDPGGRLNGDGPVIVAADYAAAAILQRETRLPVVLAPDPARLPEIVHQLRTDHAERLVMLAVDQAPDPEEQRLAARETIALVPPPEGMRFADLGRDRTERVRAAFADAAGDAVMLRWLEGRASAAPDPATPPGLRLDPEGNLLLGLRDARGRLVGVQTLSPAGTVLDTVTEPAAEAAHAVLGNAFALKTSIVLTDDYPTATRLLRETAHAVVYLPPGSDPAAVAALFQRRHPEAALSLVTAGEASPLGQPPLSLLPLAEALRPTRLEIPFEQREAARTAGAQWDPEAKAWFAPAGARPDALTAWRKPEQGQGPER